MTGLLIHDCDVLQFTYNQPRFSLKQDILVEGERIKAIYPAGLRPLPPDVEQIDADGMMAVPGMVNTHAHVPMVLFRGAAEDVPLEEWFNEYIFPMESNLTPEDVYWGAMLGIAEMIEAGITHVADHYFQMDQIAEAVRSTGIRANLAWAVFEHEGLDKLKDTAAFVKRWQDKANGRIRTWLGPHSPYLCGPDFLRESAKIADSLDVGIHLHVSETADQVSQSQEKYGISPIRLLLETGILDRPTILAHCLYPTEEDLAVIADHPAGVGQAPKTYLRMGMGLGPLQGFQKHKIPVGLATDGAASSSTLDLYEQMRLMALTQKFLENDARAMPLEDVLQIAYLGGAKVCHQPDLGDLKPGNLADIVLLRQDRSANIPRLNLAANLVYSMGAGDVDSVICNGQVLMRHRKLLTINKENIKKEIATRLERLVKRVPGRKVAFYPT
jgi:5-methylthioadenosine/S-adenosylhomocysteine deaminase